MKRYLFAAALACATVPALAADVGVSISIGQPGFYGQIDIGGYPQPQVIYQQPRVIYRSAVNRQPIYLNVPPGHAKNWRKHCRQYNACGERVYFVQNNWYERQYVPHYQNQHHDRRADRGDGRRDDRHDRGDNGHNGKNNKQHGNDHGQGRNH
ncbi:MAG: hypothetical protein B7X94_01610 [Hydrogenophilales bacterium 17-62-8]|nr:MAG: hypothetical protein B7X94_01610 [Hydrogenophilales bacterium 17-62-8]